MTYAEWSKSFELLSQWQDSSAVICDSFYLYAGSIHPADMDVDDIDILVGLGWNWDDKAGMWRHEL